MVIITPIQWWPFTGPVTAAEGGRCFFMRELRWIAQYVDGSVLKEFERTGKGFRERSFYEIRKDALISFGLEGSGLRIGFGTTDGIIGIYGDPLEVALTRGHDVWPLTGRADVQYNNIIQYKDAEATIAANGKGRATNRVTQYNIGYKCHGHDDGLGPWNYQVIIHIPADDTQNLYCTFRLVVFEGFQGRFLIRWGKKQQAVNTILRPKVAGQLQTTFVK